MNIKRVDYIRQSTLGFNDLRNDIHCGSNSIVIKYHKDELHRSKEWKNMMYPDGKVKVYIETPDETGGFHDAICWLPDYTWEVHRYSESWCILNNLFEIMHT